MPGERTPEGDPQPEDAAEPPSRLRPASAAPPPPRTPSTASPRPSRPGRPSAAPVTVGAAWRFFLPLIFMTELNAISKSVIHAFLARLPQATTSLAGFNVAFTAYYSCSSATEVSYLVTISWLRDRRSILPLLRFFCLITAAPLALALTVAFTPAGDWLYGGLFGASPAVVAEAKLATFVFSLSAPFLIARAFTFGVLMINRRTMLISWSTLARLASLGGSLVLLPRFVSGAAAGAAALVTCMAVEALVSGCFAARYFRALPSRTGPPPRIRELWRFAWPLMLNSSAEMGTVFVISIFLGRLLDPDLALAAFGVVHGLTGLMMSPMRNLLHTAQTLARTAADRTALRRFAVQVIAVFALISIGLFDTPVSHVVLGRLMGLSAELEAACAPAMRFAFVMAAAWGFSALLRGFLAGARRTGSLALTGAGRLAVAALVGTVALAASDLDGALLGLAAWFAGYGAEAAYLALRLRTRPAATARGC